MRLKPRLPKAALQTIEIYFFIAASSFDGVEDLRS